MKTYKKTQYGIFLSLFLAIIALAVFYAYYFQIGSKPIPLIPAVIVLFIFVLSILLFYKLTILIDTEKITATFGIGFIKKSVLIKDIDISSIEKVKMPWYLGIGIRLTAKGWLWNVKVGDSIYFKTKINTFLVGTDDFDTIKNILRNEN